MRDWVQRHNALGLEFANACGRLVGLPVTGAFFLVSNSVLHRSRAEPFEGPVSRLERVPLQ
ncbi:hypothetical protein DNL40_00160 [Xylanimonas oleitrophica]|uniref:Uncharacterized protein n=1 Tax=Xylanimonas oleitrophica TaxID=2607479 RepID=A0A2W5WUN7_9MICO|nr:hypothetical protein DNL40_00160 [Xylanimonas oleitrophica]